MLNRNLLVVLLTLVFTMNSYSQSSGLGVGIIIGEPTGISLKSWQSKTTALDAGVAWGFGRKGALHIHADYLIHEFNVIKTNRGRLPFYYGFGGRILFASDSRIGIRGVLGLDYMFNKVPVDIFLEVVPIFDVIPSTDISFNAGLGIRYFL